jgi:pyruvate/2-oxoglutarate dehydrogenase complex dihydrolipoamide acyltransferase (E2) component
MSVMRRRIAEHMVESRRTSAHVHTLFEVDFSAVAAARAGHPEGTAPGYLAYIARAVSEALAATPVVNASVDGANVVYHERINLGIAVALDRGLIVPVVKDADRLAVGAIDAAVKDLAARARAKQLAPEDVEGGTFTITNPGGFGSLLGMPIINQPQVAILGVGAVEPRPAVVDGAVVPRLRAFLTLGFDHRLIDGAVADRFLARVKAALEDPQWLKAAHRS